MSSVLQVSKSEWEAFLEQFTEFTKKHDLLLSRLDLALTRLEAQEARIQQQTGVGEPGPQSSPEKGPERAAAEGQRPFLERLKARLRVSASHPDRPVPQRGPRLLVCSCGRELRLGINSAMPAGVDAGLRIPRHD